MKDDKNKFGVHKIDRKTAVSIIVLVCAALTIQLVIQHIEINSELADKVGNLAFTINVSLFGVVFIILSHKELNKYVVGSFGLLFAFMLPAIATIPLVIKPVPYLALFLPIYLGAMFGWFLTAKYKIIGKNTGPQAEFAEYTLKTMLLYLGLIAIGVFALYLTAIYLYNTFPPSN